MIIKIKTKSLRIGYICNNCAIFWTYLLIFICAINALEMFNKAIVQLGNGIEKGIVFLNNAAKFSEELIRFTEELKVTKNKLNQALDSTNAILQDKNLDLFLKQGLGKAAEGISGIKLITDRLNADLKEFEESPVKFLTRGKQRKGYKLIKVEAKKKID